MSGGWHGTSRHAAALLALAARRASHAAASTSSTSDGPAARQLSQCGSTWLRHVAGSGSGSGASSGGGSAWSGVRGVSASAAPAAETLLQEVDDAEERHDRRQHQHQEPATADPQQVPRTACTDDMMPPLTMCRGHATRRLFTRCSMLSALI